MTAPDWVARANAGHDAWVALREFGRVNLLDDGRYSHARGNCDACSECTGERQHPEPHTCDCASQW